MSENQKSASGPGREGARRRHLVPILLGTAATAVLVAGGTAYALNPQGPPAAPPVGSTGLQRSDEPPLPPLRTDAENRAAAARAADRVVKALRVHPGATASPRLPGFQPGAMTVEIPGYTVARTRWWRLPSGSPRTVAHWYAQHPTPGFRHESGSSESSDGRSTVYAVDFYQPHTQGLPPRGVSIEVATVALKHGGVGIRASVLSVWEPARPKASYVQNATSIEVRVAHTRFGRTSHTTHRSFTITDPTQVLAAEVAFDGLSGSGPVVVSCPMMRDEYRDRIAFHTPSGDLVMTAGGGCVDIGTVLRHGTVVKPGLVYDQQFLGTLGLKH